MLFICHVWLFWLVVQSTHRLRSRLEMPSNFQHVVPYSLLVVGSCSCLVLLTPLVVVVVSVVVVVVVVVVAVVALASGNLMTNQVPLGQH